MCSLRFFTVSGLAHGDSMYMWYQRIKFSASSALLVIIWNGVMSLNQRQGCCWCCVTVWLVRTRASCLIVLRNSPQWALKAALIRAEVLSGNRACHLVLKRFNLALRTMMPSSSHRNAQRHTYIHILFSQLAQPQTSVSHQDQLLKPLFLWFDPGRQPKLRGFNLKRFDFLHPMDSIISPCLSQ